MHLLQVMDNSSLDLGELSGDANFVSKISNLHNGVSQFGDLLQLACEKDVYNSLSTDDKVKYDLFLSYSISTLFWMYLRTQGVDPSKHNIKPEIERVRQYNVRARQIHDRRTIMPRIDKGAAKRFVKSGLWQPKAKDDESKL